MTNNTQQPKEKSGPHHPHEGHVPGDLDPHGHRDTSVDEQPPGAHHPHKGHTPGDTDPHGHKDTESPPKQE